MPRPSVSVALVVLCVAATVGAPAASGAVTPMLSQPGTAEPRLVAAVPNPATDGDAGEFVVLDVPASGTTLELTDREGTVSVRNLSAGRVAVTAAPAATRNRTDLRVREVENMPALSNGGERLTLSRAGGVVDERTYGDAPERERVRWTADGTEWRPLGATDRPVVAAEGGHARAFVLPDAPGVVNETLAGADERVLLAGYTLTSRRVVDRLLAADRRGANVSVLLDGDPVGGISRRQADLLDELVAAGIEVRLLTGQAARYDYHHAKYVVADDRALVLTENFKPAGTGGHDSRGWGAVVNQSSVVRGLAETFAADIDARDAVAWRRAREGRTFESVSTADGEYPSRFAPARVPIDETRLLVAPDNARSSLVDIIDGANESLRVLQMSIDDRDGPFVTAALRAARRGVDVRILLSSAWYVREDNGRIVEWLNDVAEEENLPLDARLADPNGRYGKVHAKGMVVDDRTVVLGSLNWNTEAAENNREVLLVLRGEAVGNYYGRVFDADWRGGTRSLPVGLLAATLGCVLLAILVGRRVEFV